MKFILGTKLEMTQKFLDNGTVVPVTKVQAGPCVIIQVKNEKRDGYQAVQVGYGLKKKLTKPLKGHLKDFQNFRYLKEFPLLEGVELKRGDKIDLSTFNIGDKVRVSGNSKGKGFQGVVKKYGFKGSLASHGHKDQLRMPGSIGATGPAHVFKGTRMAGQMGGGQVSVKNLEIVDIDLKNNLVFIKGALPGARGTMLSITSEGELNVIKDNKSQAEKTEKVKEKTEEQQQTEGKKNEEVKQEVKQNETK